jgi:DNA-binding transcriptional LysR family regulator
VSIHSSWSANEIIRRVSDRRLDYGLIGVCATALPASGDGLTWRAISVDPVWVLLDERHPLAGRDEVALADLAGEQWVSAPGDGCFTECFAAACLRAGFTPRFPHEMDPGGVFDLVTAGRAVALCQGTVRSVPGAVAVPLRDQPLSWRHLLGWDPAATAAGRVGEVLRAAAAAYTEIVGRRPRYAAWQRTHPSFGLCL